MTKIVLATHNPGKVREIADLLRPLGLDVVSAGELGLPEPEETAKDFLGNACIKAEAAAQASNLPALADDSGFCVDGLNGDPGIYSARWAGPDKDFSYAMSRVHEELGLKGLSESRGHFVCALALAIPSAETRMFEGRVSGKTVWPPRGGHGFGYDPMFLADGQTQTFGEMAPQDKHAMSHRARAFQLLLEDGVLTGLVR
ncbi:MAG TPA: non-canonical purine NTP pyrophosphatase, RdgB/HAM1 family [Alphaproteobacteria bacterium]|nr:non-canonical purine NTP pyrophosphatase, RdgB/HAM1 family [Paracoccaceae bacterium]RCL81591.1 MAG: RdgB/HAM1 family non-canonical purine NTP pyrophosphatase [SAR116 cluster bacterium]RPH13371.1 MAG: RdgB/HAM1 family non-canonical purine NTP pyrophosphatase [Alphaproteobacteria bacterium TMED150]HBQ22729.1 non-canonical purine NTP pyrophosphatase, RdgB/HAM1 family [Alphaproteobacteria bacterium]HCJ62556.1 non-canonical purine NTP pyrophosphatase, RdgB/HAM1 family [Alphaproteobacteria bacteri|tara:strand:- start:26 stop:625 length:600 start_codon:yes stop_codon:yes gene_type:complete